MIGRLFARPLTLRRSFYAMGTEVTVTLALRRARDRARAEAAIAELYRELQGFGRDWWAWGAGALAQLNRELEAGQAIAIPASMRALFDRAWSVREATGGLFEPRVAALVRLWGFDDIARLRSAPPEDEEIERLLAALHAAPPYRGDGRYGPAPLTGWDFGGIAKGHVVDCALHRLARRGFADATLDAGGNLAVRGQGHDGPWHIGIRQPLAAGQEIESAQLIASLDVRDESVNTHGDDQRFFIHAGRRYAHLLDPQTGRPVHGLRSLTVVHADGSWAEAAGAALFVAGPARWRTLAAQLGIEQVLAVPDDGPVEVTRALHARLQPRAAQRLQVV